jgi:glycosyltransferase involved in cell wall biosynthesis
MGRIYIDARTITATPSGVGRYARALLPELVGATDSHEYVVVRHPSNRAPLGLGDTNATEAFLNYRMADVSNALLGAWGLRRLFRRHGPPDLYHSLIHFLPVGIRAVVGGAAVVVTLHDLIWLDHAHDIHESRFQATATETFGRWAIPHALRRADHVISVSEPTAERATEWIDRDRQTVVPHGVEETFFEVPATAPATPDWLPEAGSYVAAVGNDKRYKNLHRLVAAFGFGRSRLDGVDRLVLVGGCDGLRPKIRGLGLGEEVLLTGYVDDPELREVLAGARAFVFPSMVEGFGLPVLEAMAAGVPTVVSDREPMRSVAGEAALRVAPDDTEALADALARVCSDAELRERLRVEGRRHARTFTWGRSATETQHIYRCLLDRRDA